MAMIKQSLFSGMGPNGEQLINVITPGSDFVKTAGVHPEIQAFKQNLSPEPDKTYLHILALGAGEYYGSNLNNDYFPWDGLAHDHTKIPHKYAHGYKTFLNAHAFAHHQNNDPTKAYGDVLVSVLNEKMKRVELIAVVDHAKCRALGGEKILEKLIEGKDMATSMGCRIPYDTCMVCGNNAPTRKEYCECMLKRAGQILPDGRKVCVTNPFPRFFDISFVYIGADRTSHVLEKIATVVDMGANIKTASAPLRGISLSGTKTSAVKMATEEKLSEIFKEVDGYPLGQAIHLLENNEQEIPEDSLCEIAEQPDLPTTLNTLGGNGIILTPNEFTKIIMIRTSVSPRDFEDVEPEYVDDMDEPFFHRMTCCPHMRLAPSPLMESRSYSLPFFFKRLALPVKLASKKQFTKVAMPQVSRLYNAYRHGILMNMDKYAGLGSGMLTQENIPIVAALSSIPVSYALHSYWKARPEDERGFMANFIANNPNVSAALISTGSAVGLHELFKKYPLEKIMKWVN